MSHLPPRERTPWGRVPRRAFLRRSGGAALGAVGIVTLAGCSSAAVAPTSAPVTLATAAATPATGAGSTPVPAVTPTPVVQRKYGGTLRALGFAFANNLDPHQVTGSFHTFGPGIV